MRKDTWKVKINTTGLMVNEIIDKIWINRGVDNPVNFLAPLKHQILDPSLFKNIELAASTMKIWMNMKGKFLIYADVDTDGCTSAAILVHYLKKFGIDASTYINEGKVHGVTSDFTEHVLPDIDPDVVIVVDSINDTMEEYEKIWAQGTTLIILDHHIPSKEILNYQGELRLVSSAIEYPNPYLSGSGVAWKFCKYMDTVMETNFADEFLDLAATGLIADVSNVGPESMENRAICYYGFSQIVNPGISCLVNKEEIEASDIGFSIGPLVNAANRMRRNDLALRLFLAETQMQAKVIIKELKKVKEEQKALVPILYEQLESQVENQIDEPCYYFEMTDGPKELSGLLATKLCNKYCRPVLVLHKGEEYYAGSMRAFGVEDFAKIVNDSGLGEAMGHENSAGIKIPIKNYELFKLKIKEELSNLIFEETVVADISITRSQITPFLVKKLKELNRINGEGFPPITVMIEDIQKYKINSLSNGKHLSIETPDLKYLKWNFDKWDELTEDGTLSVIGKLEENTFAGRTSTQLMIEDFICKDNPKVVNLW